MKRAAWLALLPVLILVIPSGARAQAVAGAEIHGVITDPTGAVVPGAQVKVTQTTTGMTRSTRSNTNGTYSLPGLPVGPYTLEATSRGFQHYVQSGIVLQVGSNVAVNVDLKVGAVSQQVSVNANATMVQTQSTSVAEVIDQRRIVDLPLNGRQAYQFILLSGAATYMPDHSDLISSKNYNSANIPGSQAIDVAGGEGNQTNFLLDGGDNNDAFSNVNLPFPFPDALQEFTVETNGLSARYGVHPGGVVNVVTKSGTNQFHGDIFEFVRNGAFDGRNFFAPTQDTLRENQFGGTLGGPIKKNKVFGFFGYQGTRIRTAPPSQVSFVPNAAMLAGDFSVFDSAQCGRPTTLGAGFVNNKIPPSLFNQQALNILKYVPLSTDPCGKTTFGIPSPQDEDQYIGRVDWTISSKQSFFGRYFISDLSNPPQFDNNLLYSTTPGVVDRSQSMVLGHTYSLTPTTLNTAHATWTRLRIDRGPASNLINPGTVGINTFIGVPNFITINMTGEQLPGNELAGCGTCAPGHFNNNAIQLADDVDSIHGRNHWSFGGEWMHLQLNELGGFKTNSQISFNGVSSGDPWADFLLGLPNDFTQGNPEQENWRQNYVGLYVQNNVQATQTLNVHMGLRWEPYLPEIDKFGRGNHFSFAGFEAGKKTSKYTNAPPGLFYVGDPGIPSGYTYNSLADFEPRVGVAWNPGGKGTQTIRASYSIFYDMPEIFYHDRFADSAPWGSSIDIASPIGGLTNPWLGYPGGDPFPLPFPPTASALFPSEGVYINFPLETHPTYMQQWDLSYQRQLTPNWMVSATYIGNRTIHLWVGNELDPAVYSASVCAAFTTGCTTKNTNERRLLTLLNPVAGPAYSTISENYDGDSASYNGLLLTTKHRFNHNFTILANYTYSHCLDYADFGAELAGNAFQNPADPAADYGNCGFDYRQIFNLSFLAVSPKFSGLWLNRLLGGWQLAPLVTAHSGTWFSPSTGVDRSLTGVGLDRPNLVMANPYLRQTTGKLQWINTAAYAENALGTFGNAGRNSLLGPAYFDIDADVSRYFQMPWSESQRLELRFEFFDLANNIDFGTPNATLTSTSFGRITSTASSGFARILQFALKYYF